MTVGGRTSAYVAELQHLRGHARASTSRKRLRKDEDDDESDLTPLSEDEGMTSEVDTKSKKRKVGVDPWSYTVHRRLNVG